MNLKRVGVWCFDDSVLTTEWTLCIGFLAPAHDRVHSLYVVSDRSSERGRNVEDIWRETSGRGGGADWHRMRVLTLTGAVAPLVGRVGPGDVAPS